MIRVERTNGVKGQYEQREQKPKREFISYLYDACSKRKGALQAAGFIKGEEDEITEHNRITDINLKSNKFISDLNSINKD